MTETIRLRVATYNVHGCVGRGKGAQPERIADVLASIECDVIGLQELDVGRERTGRADQVRLIADRLGFQAAFGPAWDRTGHGAYGNAILSRWPIEVTRTHVLPLSQGLRCEPRSIVDATILTPGGKLFAWSTHLGVRAHEREAQGHTLLGHVSSALGGSGVPLVLFGDLNAGVDAPVVKALATRLVDVRRGAPPRTATYPAIWPIFALDHVFVSAPLQVRDARTIRTPLVVSASDHLPLVATLEWPRGAAIA